MQKLSIVLNTHIFYTYLARNYSYYLVTSHRYTFKYQTMLFNILTRLITENYNLND